MCEGEIPMTIAVTYQNEQIFPHFGHTAQFKFYEVEDGSIVDTQVLSVAGSGHSALASYLAIHHVDALICGGIGGCARAALDNAGIKLYGGVRGDADDAVEALLAGELNYDPNARCSHHDCGGHCH